MSNEELDSGRGHCLDHTGLNTKINLLLWLTGGCGTLLLTLLITLLTFMSNASVLTERVASLERAVLELKLIHPLKGSDVSLSRYKDNSP